MTIKDLDPSAAAGARGAPLDRLEGKRERRSLALSEDEKRDYVLLLARVQREILDLTAGEDEWQLRKRLVSSGFQLDCSTLRCARLQQQNAELQKELELLRAAGAARPQPLEEEAWQRAENDLALCQAKLQAAEAKLAAVDARRSPPRENHEDLESRVAPPVDCVKDKI